MMSRRDALEDGRRGCDGVGAGVDRRERAGVGGEERAAEAVGVPLVLPAHSARGLLQGRRRDRTEAVDLLQPEEWEVAAKYGLQCSTGYPGQGGGTIPDGLNNPALHDQIVTTFKTALPKAKAMNVPNLITFFGNRKGMPDAQAIDNSVARAQPPQADGRRRTASRWSSSC